ncbi:hypothetical protein D6779_00485 [Candidatus Parcubacteria bacterium]|nr:MAG: hypothetical protein D6779_00485 [Candidatus Parcubacteria bacterium]
MGGKAERDFQVGDRCFLKRPGAEPVECIILDKEVDGEVIAFVLQETHTRRSEIVAKNQFAPSPPWSIEEIP